MLDAKRLNLVNPDALIEKQRLPLGMEALDGILHGGLPLGAVTEIVSEPGHDGWWPALRAMARSQGICGVLNHDDSFHPPGAALQGVDLDRLLVVRTGNRRDALWSLERMAKNPGLVVTLSWLPDLRDVEVRRLQLAAERSGQAVLLMRGSEPGHASWGALRLGVRAEPGAPDTRRLRIEVLRMRGGMPGQAARIEIEHGTDVVRGSAVVPHRADYAQPGQAAG